MKNYISYRSLKSTHEEVKSFAGFNYENLSFATAVLKTGACNSYDKGELEVGVFTFESENKKYFCEAK